MIDSKSEIYILRPKKLDDFLGQVDIINNLKVFIKAAMMRKEALDHVLLHGSPGLGKTTLANIISNEMKSNIVTTSAPIIDKPSNLAGLLTSLSVNDILFIDEIHRLSPVIEEYLYTAMEDYKIDIIIDSGNNSKSIQLKLNPFTLIGATTKSGMLTHALRERFGINLRLEYYDLNTISSIILRTSQILNININNDNAMEIALRSRGTPRIANILLRRIRDFAQIKKINSINKNIIDYSFKLLKVDVNGLNEIDNKILNTIIYKFNGGPVGLRSLASSVGESENTIEEYYEPFLIKEGYLIYTSKGRKVTSKTINNLNANKFLNKKLFNL